MKNIFLKQLAFFKKNFFHWKDSFKKSIDIFKQS